MQTSPDCLACFVQQTVNILRHHAVPAASGEAILRRVFRAMATADFALPPPAIAQEVHRIIRDGLGADPFAQIKAEGNALAWTLLPELAAHVRAAADPFAGALRLAIAGNIIDYGTQHHLADAGVRTAIDTALAAPLDRAVLEALREEVARARRILYLGDNAGEIVLDRLLLAQLPRERVTYAVRGGPVLNDATRAEARSARLEELVRVIDSGADLPGTVLDRCSEAFRAEFAAADLILAKGQGNYETLHDTPRPIYFLFMAKCAVIARHLDCALGTLQLRRSAG